MDTKLKIKRAALKLFNQHGLINVTLRDVAKDISKSYGNITYHFRNKEMLIESIYNDMMQELSIINKGIMDSKESLFTKILKAPNYTFDITMRYLFFYVDFVEIRRNFIGVFEKIDANNKSRMEMWKYSLIELQTQNYIRKELSEENLFYLMELSGAMRTFFFLKLTKNQLKEEGLKIKYIEYTNKLFYPYLTEKGRYEYKEIQHLSDTATS